MARTIYVTEPYLPPLEEFQPYLARIWESKWLTNNGPFHRELEARLCEYLGVEYLSLFANGTLALVTALQALRISGEVITTPFSFVATAHSLLWNNIRPVFVDIDPVTMNIDPVKIESAITPQTTAVLPVHCYGNPCDVNRIRDLVDTYGLKLIYDAAHAFGVEFQGSSLLRHGDISVLSFHATKVFNTFEGGAIVCPDAKVKKRVDYLKNFGFADEVTVTAPGINGKMNELQAAVGLLQLNHIDDAIAARCALDEQYRIELADIPGLALTRVPQETVRNFSYFPILIDEDFPLTRDELYFHLREAGIFGRRYFYPLISDMPMYRGLPSASRDNLPNAHMVSNSVICLPIFPNMGADTVSAITASIRAVL